MTIGNVTPSSFLLTANLRAATDAAQSATAAPETVIQTLSASPAATNPLQGNFVTADHEQSRYITGLMETYRIDNTYSNKLMGIVEQYRLEAATTESYAEAALAGAKAARAAEELGDRETAEKVGDTLEQNRRDMEQEIEEQVAESQEARSAQEAAEAETQAEEPDSASGEAVQETAAAEAEVQAETAPLTGTALDITV